MFTRIKNIVMSLVLIGSLSVPFVVPAVVMAEDNIQPGLCQGSQLSTSDTACDVDTGQATATVDKLITQVINIFSIVVGVVSVIMIIIGGLKYITSGGDSGNVSGAKNTILYAIIGLVIVALAQIIVKFVLAKVNTATNG